MHTGWGSSCINAPLVPGVREMGPPDRDPISVFFFVKMMNTLRQAIIALLHGTPYNSLKQILSAAHPTHIAVSPPPPRPRGGPDKIGPLLVLTTSRSRRMTSNGLAAASRLLGPMIHVDATA